MDFISKLKKNSTLVEEKMRLYTSRGLAKKKIEKTKRLKGKEVVDKSILKEIKLYSKVRFGSTSYWPWLVLYTEIRGEYCPGWIPNDYYRIILRKKYNPITARYFAEYKSLDHKIFKDFSFKYLIYCISQKFYKGDGTPISDINAQLILNDFDDEVILKPELGWKGVGIEFLHSSCIDIKQLSKKYDFLIQPKFDQCSEFNKINSNSLNTLRVFTYLEPGNEPEVKYAVLRFSLGTSRVDNTSSGGGFIRVLEDGKLAESYYNSLCIRKDNVHPFTKVNLNELSVPNYNTVITKCEMAHKLFPYVRFIGWDVAIGKDEIPKLIEWNADDPAFWEGEALFGPLFDDLMT